jgi:hypothetical protein
LANDGFNRVEGVALNGVIGSENNELGNIGLETAKSEQAGIASKTRGKVLFKIKLTG